VNKYILYTLNISTILTVPCNLYMHFKRSFSVICCIHFCVVSCSISSQQTHRHCMHHNTENYSSRWWKQTDLSAEISVLVGERNCF